jgi:hypothetical protein
VKIRKRFGTDGLRVYTVTAVRTIGARRVMTSVCS